MRIAHLTTVHPRDDTRIFRKMCRSLSAAGHAVTLHVADGRGDADIEGVRIIDLGRPSGRLARATGTAWRMWREALRSRPDILHFHDPELIPGGILARLAGRPVIYDIHEYYRIHLRQTAAVPGVVAMLLAGAYGVAERLAAMCLDACVVVTPHMQRVLPLRRSIVVGNEVQTGEFTPGPIPAADRPKRVCYVGILSAARVVESMVDAAAMAGARLALAGRWYPPGYRAAIATRPGWEMVDELGQLDREQMQREFDVSRAGLLLVRLDGDERHSSNNKLYEYMAAGLPVIASDVEFAREVIDRHGCGLLVSPPTDTEAMSAAIDWILAHPAEAERMGRAGRLAVEAEHSWEQGRDRLLALYDDLIGLGVRP